MAPFGKIYGARENPRTRGILAIAKENKLELELIETIPHENKLPADYTKLNKLGRIPTFVGADGFVLSECMAIAVYLTSQNEKTALLGKTKQDYASILRWMSFCNTEVLLSMGNWFRPILGREPYNKKNVETAQEAANKALQTLEDHLMINTYLVGERITLADIFCAGLIGRGMQFVLDKAWRDQHPNVTRWFTTITNQAVYKEATGESKMCDEAAKYTPPAKEKAPPKAKEAPKPAAAAAQDDDEEEDKPAPKPKHPLEELGKPTFAIDDWKRKYKNEETREVALPWFWENMNFDEYSLWQVDYKYNDELTMTFMTANLIGGFFARLEASRKYIMGCCSVYGVTNDSVVKGAFLVRGQDGLKAFDVAPDWESYEFKKLDPKNPADKELVESMWAWDQPVEANGKKLEWADGKIFV